MEEIAKALELKKELDVLRPLDKEQEDRIMQKFRLDWNYHSNNLEGNSLTYGETKALLMFGVTAQGKPLKDHFEVTGHNEAINWVIDMVKGERPLTENFIRQLHELLLKEPYEVDAQTPDGKPTKKRINVGSYKTSPNHVKTVTGEMFYFATPEETPAKMADLMVWYNESIEREDINPILLASEFHYKFIRIHPFDDGNGRTARILMNFILMKYSYPPVIIKTEDKANYFAALRLADAGNIGAFVDYIAKNLNNSLELMIAGARGESIEEPDDIDKEIALLEKRLNSYGTKIEKQKSFYNLQEIYLNSIVEIAKELKEKLSKFDDYYLHKNVFIKINDHPSKDISALTNSVGLLTGDVREIRIEVRYGQMKKQGLENFSFSFQIIFVFEVLKYLVGLNSYNNHVLVKNYEVLSKEEMDSLVKIVVKEHNKQLSSVLK
ncbi:Fic family protein [Flavobacterium sp. C4GT6]|uniref:Fic family protein n=1 Tax=Flavobacterium sp. C4GT6 TaxID=3103818 RepID=UPI002ED3EC7F